MGLLRASVTIPESTGAAHTVVELNGEVDATNSDELYDVLESVVLQLPRLLVVDLSALTFMDSTGLRMLLRNVVSDTRNALAGFLRAGADGGRN